MTLTLIYTLPSIFPHPHPPLSHPYTPLTLILTRPSVLGLLRQLRFWGVVRGDVIAVVSRAIAIALLKLSAISSLRETLSLPAKSVPCRSTCFVRLAREARLARAALRPLQGEIDESLQIS